MEDELTSFVDLFKQADSLIKYNFKIDISSHFNNLPSDNSKQLPLDNLKGLCCNLYRCCISSLALVNITKSHIDKNPIIKMAAKVKRLCNKLNKPNYSKKAHKATTPDSFKPNLSAFLSSDEEPSENGEETPFSSGAADPAQKTKSPKEAAEPSSGQPKYKVDKTRAVPYPADKMGSRKDHHRKERERKRLLRSGAVEAMREELRSASGRPEKAASRFSNINPSSVRALKRIVEREDYEMDNFARLPETKKDRQERQKLLQTVGNDFTVGINEEAAEISRLESFAEGAKSSALGGKRSKKTGKKSSKPKKKWVNRRKKR